LCEKEPLGLELPTEIADLADLEVTAVGTRQKVNTTKGEPCRHRASSTWTRVSCRLCLALRTVAEHMPRAELLSLDELLARGRPLSDSSFYTSNSQHYNIEANNSLGQ
jgi:hypothetical protein